MATKVRSCNKLEILITITYLISKFKPTKVWCYKYIVILIKNLSTTRIVKERSRTSGRSNDISGSFEKMKNSELKEYVNSFPDDAPVSIICANPRKRKLYKLENVIWVTDQGQPLILIDIGKESDMDEERISDCEADEKSTDDLEGQMKIEDFPEVMP